MPRLKREPVAAIVSNSSGTGIAEPYTIDAEIGSKAHWNNAGNQAVGRQFSDFIRLLP